LWLKPQLLIIDQPYTGLDANSRKNLNQVLDALIDQGLHLIMISNNDELPYRINRFAEIREGKLRIVGSQDEISQETPRAKKTLPYFLRQIPEISDPRMVSMNGIHVKYGDKQVLHDINWEVKAGEKWL